MRNFVNLKCCTFLKQYIITSGISSSAMLTKSHIPTWVFSIKFLRRAWAYYKILHPEKDVLRYSIYNILHMSVEQLLWKDK